MRGTSGAKKLRNADFGFRIEERGSRIRLVLAILAGFVATAWLSGCMEFSHFGQVSDREGAFSINDVKIEQQRPGGAWRVLGTTDGKGKWNIFKAQIKDGGKIRISKPGYDTIVMYENEFLQQTNILLTPTEASRFGDEFLQRRGSQGD